MSRTVPTSGSTVSRLIRPGVKVLVDSKALLSLIGAEMDFSRDELSSRFTFNNPNIKETCGCGLSFRT